jgi:cytochrome c biogenesis protein CcmG/thiol:disulfide interchange protein DsbE
MSASSPEQARSPSSRATLRLNRPGRRQTWRRWRVALVPTVLALVAGGCGAAQPASLAPAPGALRSALAGSPPALAAIHAQQNRLLSGGTRAFRARLSELRSTPVVVNVWASWCIPCRAEFPLFQLASARLGRRVAFLGVDTLDAVGDARSFLAKFPVSYPSYEDPSGAIARSLAPAQGVPITVFINRAGLVSYFHQGAYLRENDLVSDIHRYAEAPRDG